MVLKTELTFHILTSLTLVTDNEYKQKLQNLR